MLQTPQAESVSAPFPSEMIEAFIVATGTVFEELAGTVVATAPSLSGDRPMHQQVNASITLLHDPPGLFTLSLPLPVLEVLAGRYVAGAVFLTAELINDAAGEFANVIAGQAKTILKGSQEHFRLSTPYVTRSSANESSNAVGNAVTLDFECDAGTFMLRLVHW